MGPTEEEVQHRDELLDDQGSYNEVVLPEALQVGTSEDQKYQEDEMAGNEESEEEKRVVFFSGSLLYMDKFTGEEDEDIEKFLD